MKTKLAVTALLITLGIAATLLNAETNSPAQVLTNAARAIKQVMPQLKPQPSSPASDESNYEAGLGRSKESLELEKISAELMALHHRLGDDLDNMTHNEIEQLLRLTDLYNKQLAVMLDKNEEELTR